MAKKWGKSTSSDRFDFLDLQNNFMLEAMKLKDTYFLEEKLGQTRQHVKKQRHHFVNKGAYN